MSPAAVPLFTPSTEQQKVVAHRGGHLQIIAWAWAGGCSWPAIPQTQHACPFPHQD
jgi:hypothetical protein